MLHMCFVHVQTSLITITILRIHFSRTKSTDPMKKKEKKILTMKAD